MFGRKTKKERAARERAQKANAQQLLRYWHLDKAHFRAEALDLPEYKSRGRSARPKQRRRGRR